MWPTDYTLPLLLLGLGPLLYAGWKARCIGFPELLSFRFLGILFLWMGYHFSPWLSYVSAEPWPNFILVEDLIDEGLLFSTLCMVGFLVGYTLVYRKDGPEEGRQAEPIRINLPPQTAYWLWGGCLVSLTVFLITVGDLGEAWGSARPRGYGQFEELGALDRMKQIIRILGPLIHLALACMGSLYILREKNAPAVTRWSLGGLALLIASLDRLYNFSRWAGFALLILAFLALRLEQRRGLKIAAIALAVALLLGHCGVSQRNNFNPGVGNFIVAMVAPRESEEHRGVDRPSPDPAFNRLSAMESWTRKVEERELLEPEFLESLGAFCWNLQPLPSQLVPVQPLGAGLAEILGTMESGSNVTTPALAEIYFVFGKMGCLIMVLLGMTYAWFERNTVRQTGLIAINCLLLCMVSLPVGLHNGMRAMTRPIFYSLVLYVAARRLWPPPSNTPEVRHETLPLRFRQPPVMERKPS